MKARLRFIDIYRVKGGGLRGFLGLAAWENGSGFGVRGDLPWAESLVPKAQADIVHISPSAAGPTSAEHAAHSQHLASRRLTRV